MTTYTREQIMQMDAEQLRMAIAKAKGWRDLFVENDLLWGTTEIANENWIGDIMLEVPHWPTSIADAWELEEELNPSERNEYGGWLSAIADYTQTIADYDWTLIHATPLQRCQAWLLWRNEDQHEPN